MLRACGSTDRGRIRPTNEDYFATDEHLQLCIVADGMGGHQAGEIAARIAVDAVADYVAEARNNERARVHHEGAWSPAGNLLYAAIHFANEQILATARTSNEYAGMGTTIVAALVVHDRLAVAHVGDSRLYVFSAGRLRQLTRDDSWMASMLQWDPDTNPGALHQHPMRHALTNVVGSRHRTEVHVVEAQLAGGDLLLCSTDGVHGVLDDRRLEALLIQENDLFRLARGIVQAALARGSRDNCTAVVARYQPD